MAKHWASLPPAIIGCILDHVAQEAVWDHTLARYATVNRDWQYLFEQFTFRNLSLGADDLSDFEKTVSIHSERRKWLQAVTFRADGGGSERLLPKHDPFQSTFSLLRLLKKWDHNANLHLALYLSAHTTSSLDIQRVLVLHEGAAFLYSTNKPYLLQEDYPGYIIGEIPAVKSFSIQYKGKDVTSTQTAMSLCSKLPGLEELCLQDLGYHEKQAKHFRIAELTPELPTTLKRLHILGQGSTGPQSTCRFLVQRLVWFGITTPLKELSITTSRNAAEEFFENVRNLTYSSTSTSGILHWPALESLTLTCSLLGLGTSRPVVNRFLHQAGIIALGLPRLRELRLLSYSSRRRQEVDGIFRYVIRGQGKATALCSVSKHISMSRLVMDTWRCVAWKSHRTVLRFSSDVHNQSSLIIVEGLVGKHGRSEFRNIQYPRPHWTENEGVRDLLGAVVFFVALVLFLSLLVREVLSKQHVAG